MHEITFTLKTNLALCVPVQSLIDSGYMYDSAQNRVIGKRTIALTMDGS